MDDGAGGARECLDAIKPDYDRARSEGRSAGLAIGMKNSGLGNGFREVCGAVVHFRDDGRIEVRHGWTEMGQGVHTVALQVAAQELNVDAERIDVIVDTTRELGFGQTTGSRGTLMTAGSVAAACQVALAPTVRSVSIIAGSTSSTGRITSVIPSTQTRPSTRASPMPHNSLRSITRRALSIAFAVHDVGKAVNRLSLKGKSKDLFTWGSAMPSQKISQRRNRNARCRNTSAIGNPSRKRHPKDRCESGGSAAATLAVRH